jgi:transcriptional regulator with XRE-family HTH domain
VARGQPKEKPKPPYGRVRTPADLGQLCRQERARRGLTLANLYETTGLTTRFLSEFERGKEHASVGRVLRALESLGLDVIVLPRDEAERALRARARNGTKRT